MSAIGIDLGTTNSAAAVVEGDESTIVDIDTERTMRSVVTFADFLEGDDDSVIVGNEAVTYLETSPEYTISAIKREMGNDYPIDFDGYDMTLTPEMISGLILKKVAKSAADHRAVTEEPNDVVITVPARFSDAARRCTEAAAQYAYLDNVYMLLPEPSAACVAYDIGKEAEDIETVAVYDLGGGTFDISIVNIVPDEDKGNQYVVDTNAGKQKLGGEDFDEILQEHIAEQFEERTGIDLTDDEKQMERIRQEAKSTKEKLSKAESAKINVPFVAEGENVEQEITREEFEDLTSHLVDDTINLCQEVLDDEGYNPEDIDTVLLVGGSTKMPQVKDAVKEFFGQEPAGGVNPDEAVALGAGAQANYFEEMADLTTPDDGDEEVNADDESDGGDLAKATGGGVIGAAPDDIGFELAGGDMEVLIEEGDNFPKTASGDYTTVEDNQTQADIEVYRGKDPIADNNEYIGQFTLENIREAPAGEPNITVEFEMDKSGVVRASAWDESIGDKDTAELETEFSTGAAGGGSASGKYSPPSEEEIKEQREKLPDVK